MELRLCRKHKIFRHFFRQAEKRDARNQSEVSIYLQDILESEAIYNIANSNMCSVSQYSSFYCMEGKLQIQQGESKLKDSHLDAELRGKSLYLHMIRTAGYAERTRNYTMFRSNPTSCK